MRQPKPYFRKQTQSFYVQIDGKQIPLGKDESAAWETYHTLMANRQPVTPATAVNDILGRFLAWTEKHREPLTYRWYQFHLSRFSEHVGPKLTVANLKPFHVSDWLEGLPGKDNYKNGAVRAVTRALNWAVKQGFIPVNPVKGAERPRTSGRVIYITPEQWAAVLGKIKPSDPFRDFILFLRETGCRPQEARAIEARHFDRINQQIAFPVNESKGKRKSRIIPLNNEAFAMISRLALKYPDGKLFRSKAGNGWSKNTLSSRFQKLSKKMGFKIFPYALRHAFVTDALLRGVDPTTLAYIVGHVDATMILRIYQHVNLNRGHVRAALALATGEVPARRIETA